MLIYQDNINHRFLALHYNISLKLVGQIQDESFYLTMYQNRLKRQTLPFNTEQQFQKFCEKHKITHVLTVEFEKFSLESIYNVKLKNNYYPVFITKYPLFKGHEVNQKKIEKIVPSININKMCVVVGKDKIFSLPFWKCKKLSKYFR